MGGLSLRESDKSLFQNLNKAMNQKNSVTVCHTRRVLHRWKRIQMLNGIIIN